MFRCVGVGGGGLDGGVGDGGGGGGGGIITEYLVDVEELCTRSPVVNYFQLVKVLVLVERRSQIITFCPATQPSADHSITSHQHQQ